MIFSELHPNAPGRIVHLGIYQPYRVLKDGKRVRNDKFDDWSSRILDLKNCHDSAIRYFYNELEPVLGTDFAICVVPSHDPETVDSGIRKLAQRIAINDRERIDACGCLVRTEKTPKLSYGGNRSKEVHLRSISVRSIQLIAGKEILLLDDVTTTGNSLLACVELLRKKGAADVQPVALGQTPIMSGNA